MGICDSNKIIIKQAAILNGPVEQSEIKKLFAYEPALCRIRNKNKNEIFSNIGFFCIMNDNDISFEKAFFTNNHILNDKDISINKIIELDYLNHIKKIKITENRRTFTSKKYDYTCIEIFDEDNIKKFFKIDTDFFNDEEEIFILQYDKDKKLSYSDGKITDISNNIIKYSTSTQVVSYGSPLIKREDKELILGMHIGVDEYKNSEDQFKYFATPFDIIKKSIKRELSGAHIYIDSKKQIIKFNNIINIIYENNNDKKRDNENFYPLFGSKFVRNNKNNIQLIINGKECQLKEEYDLNDGINNIQLKISNELTNLEQMFYNSKYLKNIDELKYLKTENIYSFKNMFAGCSSLSEINALSNWDVSNGNDFSGMFAGCTSLSNINSLSNWDVSKGKNFSEMFMDCSSITDVNALKNWNVSKGNNFSGMFSGCSSLSNIKGLEYFDVSNGNIFSFMFNECTSLSNLKFLQNWNVSNSTIFSGMFMGCLSLLDLRGLENWNVSNGIHFDKMFKKCKNISNVDAIRSWNVSNGKNFTGMFGECSSQFVVVMYWNFSNMDYGLTLFK